MRNVPLDPWKPKPIGPPSQFKEKSKEWYAASIIEETALLTEGLWQGDFSAILFAAMRIGELVENARSKFKEDLVLQNLSAGRREGNEANRSKGKASRKLIIQIAKEVLSRDPEIIGNKTRWARKILQEMPEKRRLGVSAITTHIRAALENGDL